MADQNSRTRIGLLLLAGIGAGAVTGIVIGLLAAGRAHGAAAGAITETVDDLKRRAELILQELSQTQSAAESRKS